MELQDAIQNRRSIRCFLPKPVPEETVRELVGRALWAPSWGNTQPWDIVIATGGPLERFKKENKEALLSGKFVSQRYISLQLASEAVLAEFPVLHRFNDLIGPVLVVGYLGFQVVNILELWPHVLDHIKGFPAAGTGRTDKNNRLV